MSGFERYVIENLIGPLLLLVIIIAVGLALTAMVAGLVLMMRGR